MKKMIAVLVAVLMLTVTAFAGTALAAGEGDLAGVWYIQSMKQGGMDLDGSILSSLGLTMTLTLNEDGTATMEATGQEQVQKGTWKCDGTTGTITFGTDLTFEADGDTLILTQPDTTVEEGAEPQVLVFGKEPPAASVPTLAPAVENPQVSDFNGAWNVSTYVAFGLPLPLGMTGAQLSMTIQDGKAAVTAVAKDLNTGETTASVEKEYTAELKDDGTLFIDFGDEEVLAVLRMQGNSISLTLREDGKMSGEIPALTEAMKALSEMSAESENTEAEQAESAEPAETADAAADATAEGDSAGDSADGSSSSGESAMDIYLIFEKTE